MADFTTLALAEARAVSKMADGTWIVAHAARNTTTGKFCVRVQRKMASTSATTQQAGGWVEIDDNAAV